MGAWIIIPVIVAVIFIAIIGFAIYAILLSAGFFAKKDYSQDDMLSGNYRAGTILMLGDMSASDKLDEIELRNVSMKLRRDEACYFEGEGFSYHTKDVVSGYKRSSHGRSMRIMRGYSVHRSNGQSDVIRKTVKTEYPGRLFITNERIVFLAERYGFDIGFDKLSNITMYDDYLEVFAGSKFYRVFTPHCIFIRDLITLMNICHEDQYPEDGEDYDVEFSNDDENDTFDDHDVFEVSSPSESVSSSSNPVSYLWNFGTEAEWLNSLEQYDVLIGTRNDETQRLEFFMNHVQAEDIKNLPVEEFYDFLYDKYFVWKFTQKNYLANSRKHLRRYVEENRLSELADIQRRLFSASRSNIKDCLDVAMEIHGLATAGASGLLSILFPSDFGTVDQFVVKSLSAIDGISYSYELSKMNPNSLTAKDGVILTKIFREKARELNQKFNTDFWTPRKIDMVLWAHGR